MAPPRWDALELEQERTVAISLFRKERLEEPIDDYSAAFERFQGAVEELLEATVDLENLSPEVVSKILIDKDRLLAFRYLSGPPISEDDLSVLADAPTLNSKALTSDYVVVQRITDTIVSCLDRRRFPWVTPRRTPSELEKAAAVLASAALMAHQQYQADRRNNGKARQEDAVGQMLRDAGFKEVKRRTIRNQPDAPGRGEFCLESKLGSRKADFIVGNWDGRIIAIECKVSNSALNSVKRLNNDAAAKAEAWMKDFGERNIVPVAVLSGVYGLERLQEAQERGLALFWGHSLPKFADWLGKTKASSAG
ncbi:MAG: XamI family restriction endonuclease [Elusimicrobia bacterium]|nr:XamI family restriction endonuclease [Elusimicrobiota bacterium]